MGFQTLFFFYFYFRLLNHVLFFFSIRIFHCLVIQGSRQVQAFISFAIHIILTFFFFFSFSHCSYDYLFSQYVQRAFAQTGEEPSTYRPLQDDNGDLVVCNLLPVA